MDALPESLTLAGLAVLLVRGLLYAIPRIVDAISKALTERETAKRITAQAGLAEVERGAANDERREREIDALRAAVDQRELSVLVRNLRCGLDASEWSGDGAKRCARLLGVEAQASTDSRDALPFDLSSAHRLYQLLLEPLADMIASKDLLSLSIPC